MTEFSYCTNVHPAEDLAGLLDQLDRYAVPIRERARLDRLGLGLWLSADVAAALAADPGSVSRLKRASRERGLFVETLNAFPYRGFHDPVVKHSVYRPCWGDPRRTRYTVDCARVLGGLLDEDAEYGSMSTLPLGWRDGWTDTDGERARMALDRVQDALREETSRCGRPVRLAIEPEPGCVLDEVSDAVRWMWDRVDPDVVGLCLDTCHLAVSHADPESAVRQVYDAGLQVFKVQVSAALEVPDPADPRARKSLAEFAEPRYLHQTRERGPDGAVSKEDDLDAAVDTLPGLGPWRVHYHVPLHCQPVEPLRATTWVIEEALDAVMACAGSVTPHREIETYTWNVLPERHRQDLVDGIAAELRWSERNLAHRPGPVLPRGQEIR
ncbi:metabolite traffic protein EboE [Saccharopolyspora sp. NPDC047091]|uniref:metabolite traffic protein EboE n=1 Tax=Saccharopolyspora sp. NPDC047091 TaxID=3155924 RepID=UPI0033C9D864